MGPKTSSGFYLSRTSAALLALLLAALLLALIVLSALYARSVGTEQQHGQPDAATANATSSAFLLSLPTDSPGPPGIWDNPRLPPHLLPVHYELELWPRMLLDAAGNYPLSGQVNISIRCVEGTDTVLLHCYKLNITRAMLTAIGNGQGKQAALSYIEGEQHIGISNLWHSPRHHYLVLQLDQALLPGHMYLLHMDYIGCLSDDYSGLFISHYKDNEELK